MTFKFETCKSLFIITAFFLFVTAFMLLPKIWQDELKLNITDPKPWQLISSHYIHENFKNYMENISIFVLFWFGIISINYGLKYKNPNIYLLTGAFIITPIISSIIQIVFYPRILNKLINECPGQFLTSGSSGINYFLIGFGFVLSIFFILKFKIYSQKEILWQANGVLLFSLFMSILLIIIFTFSVYIIMKSARTGITECIWSNYPVHLIGLIIGLIVGVLYIKSNKKLYKTSFSLISLMPG